MKRIITIAVAILFICSGALSAAAAASYDPCGNDAHEAVTALTIAALATDAGPTANHSKSADVHCRVVVPHLVAIYGGYTDGVLTMLPKDRFEIPAGRCRAGVAPLPLLTPPRT